LADRYAIERELGSGGMATVYLANDLKHDREVAVKVLRPELCAVLGGERFLREIRIAAKLNHPHILALYDSGEAEGFLYYVMPHVAGESLREKLNREKQLPMDETITLTRQVAAALDYAHQEGLIHRDIKPENILLHEGEALVADFGIALAVSAAGGTRLTDTGLSLGTPEYMSPEQATGERELDARSDVYSLGAVVYEMLVGEPPHTGNTVQAIVAKVISVTPQPISRVREAVPGSVEAAVRCALSKIPADRFASGAEFAHALTDPTFTLPTVAGAVAATRREGIWKRVAVTSWVLVAVMVVVALWSSLQPIPKPVTRMNTALPEGEELVIASGTDIALSPDGQRLVYVGPSEGRPQLWLRPLDQLHATPLAGTEGAFSPFFSPDGEAVGFRSGRQLRVVLMEGAPPVTLVDSAWGSFGDWGTDGMLYFGSANSGISRVPAMGGAPEVVTRPDTSRGELRHDRMDVLPNGKGMLFVIWQGGGAGAGAGDGSAVRRVRSRGVRAVGRGAAGGAVRSRQAGAQRPGNAAGRRGGVQGRWCGTVRAVEDGYATLPLGRGGVAPAGVGGSRRASRGCRSRLGR
jgi:serine/threonine-protein kinase